MSVRIVPLQDLRITNPKWTGQTPVFIDHDTFEGYAKAYREVFDGTRDYLEPVTLLAFGEDVESRPVRYGDKFLGMCRLNASQYVLFIIEKRDDRWGATRNVFAITEEDLAFVLDERLEAIFTQLVNA